MVEQVPNVGPGGTAQSRKLNRNYKFDEAQRGADAVEISSDVMKLKGVQGVRMDKVMEVRKAIAEGTYLTPEKLDKALDKAIDDAVGPKPEA